LAGYFFSDKYILLNIKIMEGLENFVGENILEEDIEEETADEFGEIEVADDEDPDDMLEDSYDDMDDF
jgi:hypothetical protein